MSLRIPIALALLLAACAPKTPPPPPPPEVKVATPLSRQVTDWDDYVGQFEAVEKVELRPRVSGYLTGVHFKDGDMVKAGQVLFTIDPRPYQAVYDEAKSRVNGAKSAEENAQSQFNRGQALVAANAISQQAFEQLRSTAHQAHTNVLAAEATMRTAELSLSFTKVTAPISGRVSDRRVSAGNLVNADQTVLTEIVSLDPIRFSFTGSEALYLKYQRANQAGTRASSRVAPNPVEIRLQDETDYRWKGHMEFVDNALDPTSGTIRGRALIPNPNHFLTPGMFGHMRLLGSGAYPALLVPDKAIVTDLERQVVFVIGPDQIARMRPVELGPLIGQLRVIRSGLTPADVVIVEGVQRAQPGHKVKALRVNLTDDQAQIPEAAAQAPVASAGQAVGR